MQLPSKILLGTEIIRAIYEYGLAWMFHVPLQFMCQKGDGHPVMVIPGLGTSDSSTFYMRNFLNGLGYDAHSWGLGRNIGPRDGFDQLLERLVGRVNEISKMSGGQQVSVVGWSLGGIYAREIAKISPDVVRQVVSMGSPFKNDRAGTHATLLYEFLSRDKSHKDINIIRQLAEPPDVPFTSVYSKTDGVVHWKCSIEDRGKLIENIEIPGASHLGLGHNPISMYILSDRLLQTKDNWRPFHVKK